jgi:hypothetical protein
MIKPDIAAEKSTAALGAGRSDRTAGHWAGFWFLKFGNPGDVLGVGRRTRYFGTWLLQPHALLADP